MLYALSATVRVNKIIGSETLFNELCLDGGKNEKLFASFVFRTKQEEVLKGISFEWQEKERALGSCVQFFSVRAVKVLKESCSYGMKGDIPEVLLPIEKTLANAEYCTLEKDCNNVFVYSLKVPLDCHSGVYWGKVRFQTNVKEYQLAVKISISEVCLPAANHSRGAFNVWFENDTSANVTSETSHGELYQEYLDCYNLLKSYKVPATELPVRSSLHSDYCASSLGKLFCFEPIRGILETDLENFIQAAIEATKDEEISCYLLPYSVQKDGDVYAIDKEFLKKVISRMADCSTNEINLFKKGYFYVTVIDEPTKNLFPSVRRITKDIKETIAEVSKEKDFCEKDEVQVSLLELENVVTAWPEEALHGAVDTWCPGFQGWQQADFRLGMTKLSRLGNKTWWYGCICPWYPYPNYHIDEPLLGARTEGFLRWFYDIGGNLYWAVNSDKYRGENNVLQKIDIFNGTERWSQASGDGALVFSGDYFGVKEYLPSLRLSAICQGNQDYEYCLILEKKLKGFCAKHGLRICAKELMKPVFEKAFHGVALSDEKKFYQLRSEMINTIETLGMGAVFVLERIDAQSSVAYINGYFEDGVSVEGIEPIAIQRLTGYSKAVYKLPVKNLDAVETVEVVDTYFSVRVTRGEEQVLYKRFVSSALKLLAIEDFKAVGTLETAKYGETMIYQNRPFVNENSKNSPKLVLEGDFDLQRLDRLVFSVRSFSEEEFYLSVVIEDDSGKDFKLDYGVMQKGENLLSAHFNRTAQFNGAKEVRSASRFSHYDEEIRSLNQINLSNIKKIIVEVQNAKEFCGYFPREYRHGGYEFEVLDGYYTNWEENPYTYAFLKEMEK